MEALVYLTRSLATVACMMSPAAASAADGGTEAEVSLSEENSHSK